MIWAILGVAGAAALFMAPQVHMPVSAAGAALLACFGLQSLRDGFSDPPSFNHDKARVIDLSALGAGAALSLSSPFNIVYWAALAGAVSGLGLSESGIQGTAVFLAGFMTASLLWCFFCAALIVGMRRAAGRSGWRILNLACGAGLLTFAAAILWRLIA